MATSSDHHLLPYPPLPRPMAVDRRWRANIDPAPNCPRCASPNTKFCYYNNYSLSQPRFFCKGCRRYWTRGGSLRNVPVGGGCRKSRRSRTKTFSSGASGGQCNPSPNSSSASSQESVGADIDMAAVFAKYLSHDDQGNIVNEEINEATNTPSENSHDSLTSSSCGLENVFESQKLLSSDDVLDQQTQVMEGFAPSDQRQVHDEEAIQGFISPDLASFDDMIEDVFWSDTSNLSSLTWQPVADQSQEFDSPLLPVDHSKISTNLFSSDNWSYFDTTGFEVFSRP